MRCGRPTGFDVTDRLRCLVPFCRYTRDRAYPQIEAVFQRAWASCRAAAFEAAGGIA